MVRSEHERLVTLLGGKKGVLTDVLAQMGSAHEEGGGWHDNSGFDQLKRIERDLRSYVDRLDLFVADCTVVEPKERYDVVEIGSVVTIVHLNNGEEDRDSEIERFLIAGDGRAPTWAGENDEGDSDPNPFPISTMSPLGRALMGAKPGDVRCIQTHRGSSDFRVLELS